MLSFRQHITEQRNPWDGTSFGQQMIDFIMRGDYTTPRPPELHPLDFDGDGVLGSGDIQHILAMWGQPWHPPGQDPENGGGERSANGGGRNKLQGRGIRANPVALGPRHPTVHK